MGDRVLGYDGRAVESPAEVQAAIENPLGTTAVFLDIRHGEDARRLTVPAGPLGVELRSGLREDALKSYQAGQASLQAGRFDEVLAAWAAAVLAARDAGDRAAEAWLQWNIGRVLENRNQWESARKAHLVAWTLLAGGADPATRATVLSALARCTSKVNDLPGAEKWFAQAREVNVAAGNEMWAAANLNGLGVVAYARGNLTAAQQYHTRALKTRRRLAPDSLEVAESLDNLGVVIFQRGDVDAAEALHRQGLAIRERLAPDSLAFAMSLNNLGNVWWKRRDFPTANEHHRRALTIRQRKAPGSLDVASSLNNLGLVAWSSGDLKSADDYYTQAMHIRERLAPGSRDLAGSLNNLGEVARDRGDLARTQDLLSRSLAIKQQLSPGSLAVAITLNNLGQLAGERGDFQASEGYHLAAFAIREEKAEPESPDLAESLNGLGETARKRGDLSKAAGYHERALRLRERLAPDSVDVAESLSHLGDVALAGGNVPQATDYYNRALKIREQRVPWTLEVANTISGLGDAASARGDSAAARAHYKQALAIQERLAPNSLEVATSLVALGDLAFGDRRFTEALTLFTQSVQIVEAQRRQITSNDARALLLALHSTPYAGHLRTHVAHGGLPAAFATIERSRARSLVDLLAERRLDLRSDAPAELLAEQEELDGRRSATHENMTDTATQLTGARVAINEADTGSEQRRVANLEVSRLTKRLDELSKDLATLAAQQRSLDARIRRTSPRLAALQYPEPLDLRGAQAALDPGTLLLTYVIDDAKTYLFAVTKIDFKLFTVPIGRAGLADQVRAFRALVSKERLGDPAEPGQRLYNALVRPAQAMVDRAERVLICPEGPLQVLPFAALVSRAAPQVRYFIDDRPLHTISSMTVYAETRKRALEARRATPVGPPAVSLLAFGDPVYTKAQAGPAAGKSETESTRGFNLSPLPRTREEVQAIVGLFGTSARARLGREATETSAKSEASEAAILHFASHGWIDEAMGLNSGLALSQPGALGRVPSVEDDGLLQAWEIFEHLRLNATLVVLSACQTGLGENVRGEGLVGLTRAFLYAGARSVAVSLWDVSDAGTAALMKTFYQELRNGASKDVALQRAMIAAHGDPARKHPFYWAPFILVGDWQ